MKKGKNPYRQTFLKKLYFLQATRDCSKKKKIKTEQHSEKWTDTRLWHAAFFLRDKAGLTTEFIVRVRSVGAVRIYTRGETYTN